MGRRRQLSWQRAGRALVCPGRSLWGKQGEAGILPVPPQLCLISAQPPQDSPKRPKEAEDPEGEEKEGATLEGERPLPVEAEKNSTPSEPGSGRGLLRRKKRRKKRKRLPRKMPRPWA